MLHKEIVLNNAEYSVKADLKIPSVDDKIGIIMLHGAMVNRKSLSRRTCSLAEYCSKQLNATILTPDYFEENLLLDDPPFSVIKVRNIIELCSDFLFENYGVDRVYCFGHSLGGILLGDIVNNVKNIDAIATYGGPTSVELDSYLVRSLLTYLLKIQKCFKTKISIDNYFWIFDKETRDYYESVIKHNIEYQYENYQFDYKISFILELLDILKNYEKRVLQWNKPALFMFGNNDQITYLSKKHMSDGSVNGNIHIKHIPQGSHITPCREESFELVKIAPMVDFFKILQ